MATYCMIWKKFHQKYLLVIINYPPERILRQYISMSNFLIFGVFKCLLHKNSKMSLRPVFSDRGSCVYMRITVMLVVLKKKYLVHSSWIHWPYLYRQSVYQPVCSFTRKEQNGPHYRNGPLSVPLSTFSGIILDEKRNGPFRQNTLEFPYTIKRAYTFQKKVPF